MRIERYHVERIRVRCLLGERRAVLANLRSFRFRVTVRRAAGGRVQVDGERKMTARERSVMAWRFRTEHVEQMLMGGDR
jgi:hypothetical protein